MSDNLSRKENAAEVDTILDALLKDDKGNVELPEIPLDKSEGLLTKLRDRDVPVLATPIAHG